MNSRKCNICNSVIHRTSYAKHLTSTKLFESEKQNELIKPQWPFKELLQN